MKLKYLVFSLFFIFYFNFYSQFIPKQGGIGFRTDDDQPISRYTEYASLFNNYSQHFTFAINLGKDQITPDYVDMLRGLQSHGHEMMDHTPWHSTIWFATVLSTDIYLNHPGVHRVYGSNIELKHVKVDVDYANLYSKRNGYVNIDGNRVTNSSGIFADFSKSDCYLYFPLLDTLVFIDDKDGWIDDNTVEIENFWKKEINLGVHQNVKFYNFDYNNIHLTIDAIKALGQESQRLADHYGLVKPYVWIQPGGYHPHLHRKELKLALEDEFNYNSAGIFPDPSLKVFNEYNPDNDKQFGMNYGDFRDDIWTLEECKEYIADKVAKHHVLFGLSHFTWMELLGGWDGFLERTEGLIQWCMENNIPIRTYSEWSDILYSQKPDPFENIIPPLYIDYDENTVPDGYNNNSDGQLDVTDGAVEITNYSYSIHKIGELCKIEDLGGVEKGENEFEIWTKGAPGDFIEVDFKIGNNHKVFKFSAETSDWTKHNLSQSLNGNTSLNVPDNISLIDITVTCSEYSSGSVKVSDMSLKKKGLLLSIKVFLQGAYKKNNEMNNFLTSYIPHEQPFSSEPWNYNGHESISGPINSNIVDWILVSIKNEVDSGSFLTRRAALLNKEGYIVDLNGVDPIKLNVLPGSYYIQIDHRNHLSIMSSEPVAVD